MVTADDQARHDFYRAENERRQVAAREPEYLEYLAHLAVEVQIDPLDASGYERAAQLTARTTQFNINGDKVTASQLEASLRARTHKGWAVSAKDRYGDYGTVGLILVDAAPGNDQLHVEQFLLSCRALGRGVEHRMLAHLGHHERRQVVTRFSCTPGAQPETFRCSCSSRLSRRRGRTETASSSPPRRPPQPNQSNPLPRPRGHSPPTRATTRR